MYNHNKYGDIDFIDFCHQIRKIQPSQSVIMSYIAIEFIRILLQHHLVILEMNKISWIHRYITLVVVGLAVVIVKEVPLRLIKI